MAADLNSTVLSTMESSSSLSSLHHGHHGESRTSGICIERSGGICKEVVTKSGHFLRFIVVEPADDLDVVVELPPPAQIGVLEVSTFVLLTHGTKIYWSFENVPKE